MFNFSYLFDNKTYKEKKFKELYDKYWYILNPNDTNIYDLEHLKMFLNDVFSNRDIDYSDEFIEIYGKNAEEYFMTSKKMPMNLYKYIMAYGNSTTIKQITEWK